MLGVEPKIFKNDEIDAKMLEAIKFSSIIISPGPGNPEDAGISMDIIKKYYKTKKILGVCLGHQCIAQCFGAKVINAAVPVHGKCSRIYFRENELLKDIPQGFSALRYHSLIVEENSLKPPIVPFAHTGDGLLMGVKIDGVRTYGIQFHPEAVLTEFGIKLIDNFIRLS